MVNSSTEGTYNSLAVASKADNGNDDGVPPPKYNVDIPPEPSSPLRALNSAATASGYAAISLPSAME